MGQPISATDTTSPEPPESPPSFASPLTANLEISRFNQCLKDARYLDFLLGFLEPRREVDIPTPIKFGLAIYLRRTAEAACFDCFRRWMPEQVDLIAVHSPIILIWRSGAVLLCSHYKEPPAEAFGLANPKALEWSTAPGTVNSACYTA